MHLSEQPVAFLLAQKPPAGGVADQLLGVLNIEVRQASPCPDHVTERVRDRASQHVRDAGQGFEQGRDLRTAEFRHHDSSFFCVCVAPSRAPGYRWNSRMAVTPALV